MSYSAQTFVADEQPTTAKWNLLWSNDASFNDGSGFQAGSSSIGIPAASIKQEAFATSWSPSFTGFSANPTGTGISQRFGNFGYLNWISGGAGNSNGTTFTMSAPWTWKRSQTFPINFRNGGTNSTTPGTIVTAAGSTTMNLYTDWNNGAWSGSSTKFAEFTIVGEIQ